MGKSNTWVELQYKMATRKNNTGRAREHDKTKYRWPVLVLINMNQKKQTFKTLVNLLWQAKNISKKKNILFGNNLNL